MPKHVWSKEEVLAELKRFRKDGPRMNRKLDDAARRLFGSLRAALHLAGLPCGRRPTPYGFWSKEVVIETLRQRNRDGKSLGLTRREDPALYSAGKRLFGNWSSALTAAGIPRPPRDCYTADEVRLRIIDLYERELPLTLSSQKDSRLGWSAKKHFGGWRRAVVSLGLECETQRTWTDQGVIDAILYRRASGLDLFKTGREDPGLFGAAVKRYGTWLKALKAAGIDCQEKQRWTKEKVIGRLQHYAVTFPGNSLCKIDSSLVCAAARRFGSLTKALEVAGATSLMKRWNKARVILEIQSRYSEGEPTEVEGLGDCRLAQASKRFFGSWSEAVEAAGLSDRIPAYKPPRRWTTDDVVAVIRREYSLGRSLSEIAKNERGLQSAARMHFGRWRLAVKAAGIESGYRFWTRESVLAEIRQRFQDGKSLSSYDRNNTNLVYAGRRHFGSWPTALQIAGIPKKRKKSGCSS